MTKWFWIFDVSPNPDVHKWFAIGKGDNRVPWPEGVTDDWLREYGLETKAAAVRSAGGRRLIDSCEWRKRIVIKSKELPDPGLHYKIYRCYEIVILDDDGNQVGECEYSYGTKALAESQAKHSLKMAMMDYKEGC